MRLAWVELRRFRNHEHTRLDGVAGRRLGGGRPHAVEGKTNLLEGMYVLYALGSPRIGAFLAGAGGARGGLRAGEFETSGGRVLVEVEVPSSGRQPGGGGRLAGPTQAELRRQVRAVLFGPFDLPIVIGDPSKRRRSSTRRSRPCGR